MQTPKGQRSDDEVVQEVLLGNADAFEIIMERHGNHILRILKRHLPPNQVEDVAQETFIRIFKSLKAFHKKESFNAWLSAIAVRSCYDFWRKQYRSREMSLSSLTVEQENWLMITLSDDSRESFDTLGRQREAREILDCALSHLSAEDRMVIVLVYLEELSVKEAARLLGWSVANVKIRSFRARKKLHRLFMTHDKRNS